MGIRTNILKRKRTQTPADSGDQTELRRTVFNLGLPAVGEQLLNLLVGLVDTFLVGHLALSVAERLGYGSAQALAAVGVAGYVVWTATTLFIAVAVGATALIARAIGAGRSGEANEALGQSIWLSMAMGVLTMAVILLTAPVLVAALGAPADVAPLATSFLRITALTMPLAAVLFVGNAALRGIGDTRTPLVLMLVVNGLNIAVAWLLVNGHFGLPGLGVEGSAWGAAVARGVGGLLVLLILARGRGRLRLSQIPWPRREMSMRLLHVGLPAGAEQLAFQSALIVYARMVTGLGTVAFAAHNTVLTIESASFLPGAGFAAAATTLVGQSLGANDGGLARRCANEAFRQGVIFMGVMGVLFVVIPEVFLRILVNDPAVVAAGIVPLRTVGIAQPFLAASFIYSGALRGAGDTRFPFIIKLISPWLLRLPIAMVLIPSFGLIGAWIALSSDLALQGALAWWRFRGNRWERIRV